MGYDCCSSLTWRRICCNIVAIFVATNGTSLGLLITVLVLLRPCCFFAALQFLLIALFGTLSSIALKLSPWSTPACSSIVYGAPTRALL